MQKWQLRRFRPRLQADAETHGLAEKIAAVIISFLAEEHTCYFVEFQVHGFSLASNLF
jgi:hypothetical protein